MTQLRLLVAAVAVAWYAQTSSAQSAAVAGRVVDARTQLPLPVALVAIEGHAHAAQTDAEGHFRFNVRPGRYTLTVSLVGYALVRQSVEAIGPEAPSITIQLAEGAGPYEERVTVSGAGWSDTEAVAGGATIHGRELQALRGLTLDDPLRTLQALPSAASTDDFYGEFAVRGSPPRHVGLTVDGVPSRYLMHSVHGVTDGGSIAMINSDAVGGLSLMPGSYPQRYGRRLGAQVDLTLREGARDGFRARAGLSGTSASGLAEGPFGGGRGAWLVSARRSYLDLLLKRIDEENSLAFGFTDGQAKLVFDVTARHQLQMLAIAGASAFDEKPERLGVNDEASVDGHSGLAALKWRFTPSSRFVWTQQLHGTGLAYESRNRAGTPLDESVSAELGWRTDATIAARAGVLLEVGADAQLSNGRHSQWRSLNDEPEVTALGRYRERSRAASVYGQATLGASSRFTLAPGVRVDHWSLTGTSTSSPWITTSIGVASRTRVRAGAGVYRQFADFEQVHGVRGGGADLKPETARHVDLGVSQRMPLDSVLQVSVFARRENDVLWTPGAEPRRLPDGSFRPGRGDARWVNTLNGDALGIEVVLRRDASSGLSGWAGYSYGRHRYTDAGSGEQFWADHDQRHALSLFGYYGLSNSTSASAKFRYGSNYPLVGYIREQPLTPDAPHLFGGGRALFFGLGESRNALRLPAYARLDVRGDRTFTWGKRRVTVFAEVANALNRRNLRNVPYGVDPTGRVLDPTDSLMPIVPSAGFVIEF